MVSATRVISYSRDGQTEASPLCSISEYSQLVDLGSQSTRHRFKGVYLAQIQKFAWVDLGTMDLVVVN